MTHQTSQASRTGTSPLSSLVEHSRRELQRAEGETKEIDLLIRQSESEVEKLAQRNTQLATKVRQVEMNLDTYPRSDIREVFAAAQDAQTRLFMMRGQMEQLQAKRESLQRYTALLQRILEGTRGLAGVDARGPRSQSRETINTIVQIIEAQEDERRHLARQMHDGPAQSLTNLILQAEIVERLYDTNPEGARAEIGNLKNAVNATFQKIRDFIFNLRPMMLDDLGLVPTLRRYVQAFEDKAGISANLALLGKERRLPSHTEIIVFRGIQALLDNVQRHAAATHTQITLDMQDTQVIVSVEDDGSGFDPQEAMGAKGPGRGGLASLQDRVRTLGGEIEVESGIGRGTRVRFHIPTAVL